MSKAPGSRAPESRAPESRASSEGLPRRFLPAFLLLSLRAAGTSYGYELCEAVRSLGVSADLAAVYRGLRTMQQRDLVTSAWISSDAGPDRRLYSLTAAGRSAATESLDELAMVRDGLSAALEHFGPLDSARA